MSCSLSDSMENNNLWDKWASGYCCIVPGLEKNQRMMAQRTSRRGMMWMAFSADLIRRRSLFATWERGSYVGRCRCWSEESSVVGLEVEDGGEVDEEVTTKSSETLEALADLCIFELSESWLWLEQKMVSILLHCSLDGSTTIRRLSWILTTQK